MNAELVELDSQIKELTKKRDEVLQKYVNDIQLEINSLKKQRSELNKLTIRRYITALLQWAKLPLISVSEGENCITFVFGDKKTKLTIDEKGVVLIFDKEASIPKKLKDMCISHTLGGYAHVRAPNTVMVERMRIEVVGHNISRVERALRAAMPHLKDDAPTVDSAELNDLDAKIKEKSNILQALTTRLYRSLRNTYDYDGGSTAAEEALLSWADDEYMNSHY